MTRELDAEVAEKVMGWGHRKREATFKPSTDIAAAMQVVEKMQSLGFGFVLSDSLGHAPYTTRFINGANVEKWGDTLPKAICRAALAAAEEK